MHDVYFYSTTYGPMLLHEMSDGPWLFTTGPDGRRWVSFRQATEWDLVELVPMRGLIPGITPCALLHCARSGFPCYADGNTDGIPDEWLCKQHQIDDGFCPKCGREPCGYEYHNA